jgi:hypothetical protein
VLIALEARPFLPIDLPMVRRLIPHGVSFDSEMGLTSGMITPLGGAFLSSVVPLTDFGTHVFIVRDGEAMYAAQFRHRSGDPHAHISFIAPGADFYNSEAAWFALIDAMTVAAGKRGAHTLNAEIDEHSEAFVILRRAGFALYARQDILMRMPAPAPEADPELLRPATEEDCFAINLLISNIVPRMVLQADSLPDLTRGLVLEQGGRINAFVAITEGREGTFIQPFLHPEMDHQAGAIHAAVLARLTRVERLPTYVCVRRYQDWLRTPLAHLGFQAWASQAVMVKHTVARIEHPILSAAPSIAGAVRIVPPIKIKVKQHR